MALNYSAYLVTNEGDIAYISTVHTRKTAKDLVDYWKRSSVFQKSFYCMNHNIPPKYSLKVKDYWDEYEKEHPTKETEYDADTLPFYTN